MADICNCINKECKILQWCKRGLKLYQQGELIDFKHICNMDNKYEHIILIDENSITEPQNT